jgi:3-isopropylmalate/(R)-2-methylmalate dehydratase small subunit
MTESGPILVVSGRGLPLRGDDVDTDRIMPARFLRGTSFEGLETHVFEDDRAANPRHAFNDPKFRGAALMIVNRNFGCGSSREHAPQGLVRAGIRALIGESFSEIFQGNAAMLGLPCFVADPDGVAELQTLVERAPDTAVAAHVDTGVIKAGSLQVRGAVSPALRDGFVSGQWNPTLMLLDRFDEVERVARTLPYLTGFRA